MTMTTLTKGNMQLGLSFRDSVHYGHGRKQADMVLEKELRVLHLDQQGAGRDNVASRPGLSICDFKPIPSDFPPTKPHLLQQSYA